MGRKPKRKFTLKREERLTEVVTFNATPSMKKKIEEVARFNNMSTWELIRRAIDLLFSKLVADDDYDKAVNGE